MLLSASTKCRQKASCYVLWNVTSSVEMLQNCSSLISITTPQRVMCFQQFQQFILCLWWHAYDTLHCILHNELQETGFTGLSRLSQSPCSAIHCLPQNRWPLLLNSVLMFLLSSIFAAFFMSIKPLPWFPVFLQTGWRHLLSAWPPHGIECTHGSCHVWKGQFADCPLFAWFVQIEHRQWKGAIDNFTIHHAGIPL